MSEYILVFNQGYTGKLTITLRQNREDESGKLVVPIASAFSLDHLLYRRFLEESGVLAEIDRLMAHINLNDEQQRDTIIKKIRALIVEAEVLDIISEQSCCTSA